MPLRLLQGSQRRPNKRMRVLLSYIQVKYTRSGQRVLQALKEDFEKIGRVMIDYWWLYVGGCATSIVYAIVLHIFRAWWEPYWIWTALIIVFVGVSYTGVWMYALTIYSNVPTDFATSRDAMMWINWRWVYMFCWTALPIILWRVGVFIVYLTTVNKNAIVLLKRITDHGSEDQ